MDAFLGTLPGWAQKLARAVRAKQANTFVLHGVPADLVPVRNGGTVEFLPLDDFLPKKLLSGWPAVITYNRAEGLGFATSEARQQFFARLAAYDAVHGTHWSDALPRDAANAFALLDSYFRQSASLQPARPVALLLPYAETLVPNADAASRGTEDRAILVYLRKWAQDPVLLAKNVVVVLVAESLAELDPKLVRAAATREIEIPRPDEPERLEYLAWARPAAWYAERSELSPKSLAQLTAGMTRGHLAQMLDGADAEEVRLSSLVVRATKKEVLETEGLGLLEYVEPRFGLDMVAGMPAVKARLARAVRAIARGNPSAVPMGYLVCGPVGSAKTFLVECFAHDLGFPVVKLKNFRSMWVGSTEANLERILKILSSLTPVGVMIDEADAALGNREQSGDSGTQQRVFASISSFMADTANRGKVLWFLITARPDLLPVDLKRQGRAEEHIPLFYPETVGEIDEIYRVLRKKLRIATTVETLVGLVADDHLLGLSGSDLEAILVRSILEAESAERSEVTGDDLKRSFDDFLPATSQRERELQILCAVLECTSRELLPEKYKSLDRSDLATKISALKRELRAG